MLHKFPIISSSVFALTNRQTHTHTLGQSSLIQYLGPNSQRILGKS